MVDNNMLLEGNVYIGVVHDYLIKQISPIIDIKPHDVNACMNLLAKGEIHYTERRFISDLI